MLRQEQVLAHLDGELNYGDAPTVYAHFECSNRAYAVEVKDAANSPRLERGFHVVIDPSLPAEPGNLVHAAVGKPHRFVIGELWQEPGDVTVIRPFNPAWPAARSDREYVQVLGTVSEWTVPARRS